MSFEIRTEVGIEAPAERVWEILTDFPAYADWNPFIRSISGEVKVGARLKVRVQPSGGKGMSFRPTVQAADPGSELRWLGRLLLPGIFDGEHRFVIESLEGGRVMLHHSEQFRGLLVPLFRKSLDTETRRGFEEMNAALKERTEATPAARASQ
jgi:hypothetical protein